MLRGIRSRGVERSGGDLTSIGTDNDFVLVYSQWDGKQSYDAFRGMAYGEQPAARRKTQDKRNSLTTAVDWNTYRPVHTRSAPQSVAA